MAKQTTAAGRRRFTENEYHAMVSAGIIDPHEQVELRDGLIFVRRTDAQNRNFVSYYAGPASEPAPADELLKETPSLYEPREVIDELVKSLASEWLPRRFSVDEYYQMAETGILAPDERVELLAGELFEMAPMGDWHGGCITNFDELLQESIGRRATKRVQMPLRLNDEYAPEPDLVLLRRRSDAYKAATPRPEDVLLLIEVADSTAANDRRRKLPDYARFGIPEVWLAVRDGHHVEVHAEPVDGVYTRIETVGMGGVLTPTAFPDVAITVSDVISE